MCKVACLSEEQDPYCSVHIPMEGIYDKTVIRGENPKLLLLCCVIIDQGKFFHTLDLFLFVSLCLYMSHLITCLPKGRGGRRVKLRGGVKTWGRVGGVGGGVGGI